MDLPKSLEDIANAALIAALVGRNASATNATGSGMVREAFVDEKGRIHVGVQRHFEGSDAQLWWRPINEWVLR